VLALTTDGPETPGPHHVTDDGRSDYDKHEDSNTHSTKREDDEPLSKDELIQPLHHRTLSKNQDESRKDQVMHLLLLPLLYAFHGVFSFFFLSILFHFLFFLYSPPSRATSAFAFRTRREGNSVACFCPHMTNDEGLFDCRDDVYSRRKTQSVSSNHPEMGFLLQNPYAESPCLDSCKSLPSFVLG
jgi:hypothetical protein